MAEGKEILLEVKVDTAKVAQQMADATNQVRILKQEQKLLTKAFEEGTIADQDYAKAMAESKAELEKANRQVKSSTALLQAETLARIDDNSSLDEQRQALNAAQKAYANLSGEELKAANVAGGFRDQIAKLSDKVKEQEAAIGDARRNVGNYAMQTAEAASKMGFFGKGLGSVVNPLKNVTTGLKAASATPFLAVFSLIITVLTKLADRFQSNAAAMEKLTPLMGAFAGVGNLVNKVIDKIAEGLGWIAEKAVELAKRLGVLKDTMSDGVKIAQEDLAIQKEQQRVALANAESQRKIAQLRAAAAEKDKYTAAERLAMLQQASNEEEAISKRNYELAKREYELQVLKNKQSKSSMDDLKKENDLKIAMINSETALFEKRKELNTRMSTLREQMAKEEQEGLDAIRKQEFEAAEQHAKDLLLLNEIAVGALKDQMQEAQDALEALNEDEEEEDILTPEEQARKMFGLDAEGVAYFMELYESGVSFAEAKTQAISDYQKRLTAGIADSMGQLGNAFSAMGDALGSFAEENEDAAKAQKAFAFIGILLNQAQSISSGALAIAEGVASAAALPFPANIPAIISVTAQIGAMIAGVMSTIAQSKQIFAQADQQKFAAGGIVGGNSYSGDHVPVMANSGEMFINTDSQKRLLGWLQGKDEGAFGINYEMMAAAMANVPAPIVDYTEMQQFGQKVATYKEIAAI